jgi:RNA-binding protein 8A
MAGREPYVPRDRGDGRKTDLPARDEDFDPVLERHGGKPQSSSQAFSSRGGRNWRDKRDNSRRDRDYFSSSSSFSRPSSGERKTIYRDSRAPGAGPIVRVVRGASAAQEEEEAAADFFSDESGGSSSELSESSGISGDDSDMDSDSDRKQRRQRRPRSREREPARQFRELGRLRVTANRGGRRVVQGRDDGRSGGPIKSVEGWFVFVRGVHEEATEDDILDLFVEYGNVRSAHVPLDRGTGKLKGYGIVEYAAHRAAADAIQQLDRTQLLGRDIRVDWAFFEPRAG